MNRQATYQAHFGQLYQNNRPLCKDVCYSAHLSRKKAGFWKAAGMRLACLSTARRYLWTALPQWKCTQPWLQVHKCSWCHKA